MNAILILFRHDGSRREFPLKPGVTRIGRKDDCDIRIPLAEVSRHHCELVADRRAIRLRDLGGANGTLLNGQRVEDEELEAGDEIRVGPLVFLVRIDGRPGEDEMKKHMAKFAAQKAKARAATGVVTSKHVLSSDDEVDPIAALEALASSADQTAINPEEDND